MEGMEESSLTLARSIRGDDQLRGGGGGEREGLALKEEFLGSPQKTKAPDLGRKRNESRWGISPSGDKLQEVKLERTHQQPAVRNQIRKTG